MDTAGNLFGTASLGGAWNEGVEFVASRFQDGDIDGDDSVDVKDVFSLIDYLFGGGFQPVGSADVNDDGIVDAADIFYLIDFLFANGAAPI